MDGDKLTIITLMAGRTHLLDRWAAALLASGIPQGCTLAICDNSPADSPFGGEVSHVLDKSGLASYVGLVIRHRVVQAEPEIGRVLAHERVAMLYEKMIRSCTGADTTHVLTAEDDVFPCEGAFPMLESAMTPGVAAAGSLYRVSGRDEDMACAMTADGHMPPFGDVPKDVVDVGMVGWGFTLWNRYSLAEVGPIACMYSPGFLGSDDVTCRKLRAKGHRIVLNGNVICEHCRRVAP